MVNSNGINVGIDLGSRTIKVVLMDLHTEDGPQLLDYCVGDNTGNPQEIAETLLDQLLHKNNLDKTLVKRQATTGYGRYLLSHSGNSAYPETICMVRGMMAQNPNFPNMCTLLDIGGQDTKVARLSRDRPLKYKLNDFCAAGTGRFLENVARVLGLTLEQMAEEACRAEDTQESIFRSKCAVFIESEVVEKIARGYPLPIIAAEVHNALIDNHIKQMFNYVTFVPPLYFLGGVARNKYMVKRLSQLYGDVIVPGNCQVISAIGAVFYDRDQRSD